MIYQLAEGWLDPPADKRLVDELSSALESVLPCDYLDFLRQHDGGEGFVGERYIIFWKASELVDFNREYQVEKYAPGIFLFGSSGGGEGYGFDTELAELPIVRIPFIGMGRALAIGVAKSFADLFVQRSSPP